MSGKTKNLKKIKKRDEFIVPKRDEEEETFADGFL